MSSLYKPADLAEIKKRLAAKDSKGNGGGFSDNNLNFYRFPQGTERVVLRYLPSPTGIPGKIVKKHYNMPEVKDFICFRTHDMDCDICNVLHEYEHKLDTQDWQASSRSYLTALIISDPTQPQIDPKVPHIAGQPEGNLYWVFKMIQDPDVGDICDPYAGFNVAYNREEHNGKFNRVVLPRASAIAPTKEEVEAILAKAPDLDKIWRKPDDVFLKKLQDVSQKLRVVIENRFLTLSNQPVLAPNPDTSAPVESTAGAPVTPPLAPQAKSNKPASAPDCFGDASAFYMTNGNPDPNNQKCVSCPFDYHCGESIKKRG